MVSNNKSIPIASRKKFTQESRIKAVTMFELGLITREIGEATDVNQSCVICLLKCYKETGSVCKRKKTGRPKKISSSAIQYFISNMKKNRQASSNNLAASILVDETPLWSASNVHKALFNNGYNWHAAIKKPRLTKKQLRTQLQ